MRQVFSDQGREPDLPKGTITFLFTDIEESSKLWEEHREAMGIALARHEALLREAIASNRGYIFKTVGDSFCAAFETAPDVLSAAIAGQRAIGAEVWGEVCAIRVAMAMHTGTAEERDGDYFGPCVNRCARLVKIAHGGQTLLSQTAYELVRDALPEGVSMKDLGEHRLRDLARPERVFQLRHPDLPADFPPLKSLDVYPTNLPVQTTSFIGREREMGNVKRSLSTTRLLTLIGPGGCGKTRLSLQVAADLLEEFTGGVWLVELAALADPALVPQTVASTLGVREETGRASPTGGAPVARPAPSEDRPLLDKLIDFLQPKKVLLILDNCEHLIAACAQLAEALLRACPNLQILATSREGLGIAGEAVYPVPSLTLPDLRSLMPVESMTQYEAVRLFIERAVAALPTFQVTNQNAPAVAQICHRLDGIPLAIELAAARVKVLSVEQIAARLDDRFRLLTGGSRTALPRQQTLQAALDWSFNLLSEAERVLLRRLSVFAGGWTLEAAEKVCKDLTPSAGARSPHPYDGASASPGEQTRGLSPLSIEEYEVLDLLTRLVEKSLAVVEEEEGERRYRLLETMRQYSRNKLLETEEAPAVRNRHRDWFLELAERAEPGLEGRDQESWLNRLEREHDNLRLAMQWSMESEEEIEAGLRLAGALWYFWYVHGYWSEGREWLRVMLEKSNDASAPARAKALSGAGVLAWAQDDHGRAQALLEEALSLLRELGDKRRSAYTLNTLGLVARDEGNYERASTLLHESLALSREVGNKLGVALSLYGLARMAWRQKDYNKAAVLCAESLSLSRELGYKRGIAFSLDILGRVAWDHGDYERSMALVEESLALFRGLREKFGIAHALRRMGLIARYQGDYERARALSEEGLSLFRELGDKLGIAECLGTMAEVACIQRQFERTARLLGAAEAMREAIGAPLPPAERAEYEEQVAAARAGLEEEAFAAAWAQGRAMTSEQAMNYALEKTSDP